MSVYQGQCLCGDVTWEFSGKPTGSYHCHCTMCRRWGGGPLLAVDCGTQVRFEGRDGISVFNSSQWAERGFCRHCGTHLFYRLKQSGKVFAPAGLFDKSVPLSLDHEIFIEDQPAYYQFANKTKRMTGEEVFAAFAAKPE